ncbi:MAG: nicotinate-nicotinamide nucleotide adenylyltransferase [Actinomycetota bacterium]|nr:nicotinate-nicotinamide nucleotide adenylyltransferase [Actinomycetota bacterium]
MCAQEAHARLSLDSVLFMPVGQAPHRVIDQDPGGGARARLCERAVEGDPRFAVSLAEIERAGPSYTADTLRLLSEGRAGDELVLILGADQAAALPSWREPETVLALARVAAASREGVEWDAVARRLHGLAGHENVEYFHMPRVDVSSSLVRARVAEGLPVRYLVPGGVAAEIESRGLYGAPAPARVGGG